MQNIFKKNKISVEIKTKIVYNNKVVQVGELAVPCTRNPL